MSSNKIITAWQYREVTDRAKPILCYWAKKWLLQGLRIRYHGSGKRDLGAGICDL